MISANGAVTYVEIDREIISTAILLPSRVGKGSIVYKLPGNRLVKLWYTVSVMTWDFANTHQAGQNVRPDLGPALLTL